MLKRHTRFHKDTAPGFLKRFCPDYRVRSVSEIDPEDLVESGIKAVLLDLDNTLVPWRGQDFPTETIVWVGRCKDHGLMLCLVSNTRNRTRLFKLSEELGIPAIAPLKMKPAKQGFTEALDLLSVKPSEAIMVGDQMFTDVWGGNRSGLVTVWVERMHPREFIGTKVSRFFERVVLGILELFRGRRAQ